MIPDCAHSIFKLSYNQRMKLRADQLSQHLDRQWLPGYWIAGDEPLQVQESLDRIRAAARKRGFTERHVFDIQAGFDWGQVMTSMQSLSLFSQQQLIELRVNYSKVPKEIGQQLQRLSEMAEQHADTVILISSAKLDSAVMRTQWYQSVGEVLGMISVWPLDSEQLATWISERAQSLALNITPEAQALLVELVEGNLLAARQELEKLALSHTNKQIDADILLQAVADSARYSVYELANAVLAGDLRRATRMLQRLQQDNVATTLVLWVLTQDIRLGQQLAAEPKRRAELLRGVWSSRKAAFDTAVARIHRRYWGTLLQMAYRVDQAAKGLNPDMQYNQRFIHSVSDWSELTRLVHAFCHPILPDGQAHR